MRSFQNRVKNFERYYGVHFRSLRRSRRFMTLFFISLLIFIYVLFQLSSKSRQTRYLSIELESCMQKNLDKYSDAFKLMNAVATDDHAFKTNYLNSEFTDPAISGDDTSDEHFFLPYTGNGYIGLAIQSKEGLFVNFHKSLSLNINYNPLAQVYIEALTKSETSVVDYKKGIVRLFKCYQNGPDCFSVENVLFAHRSRPSVLIEEVIFNNPTKESVTFDILQMAEKNWNNSRNRIENIDGSDFMITSGIVDVNVDYKIKHLCVSVGTTRLPITMLLNAHDFNQKHTVITVVKYSSALLSGKTENLNPILTDLETNVINEIKSMLNIGFKQLKKEHIQAWENIWESGFGISNSLASGAMNGNQLNGSIYFLLTNQRAPMLEVSKISEDDKTAIDHKPHFNIERCYEGFSILNAVKLWKLPRNEIELSDSSLLWQLTLQKHGCGNLLELGAYGLLQAIILSLGGFKFTHHHLDLNLNPRQLHRDYEFRRINYANISLISVDVEVGVDNHAMLYVTLNELIDKNKKFYACDAGCIDPPVELKLNDRQEFPVKLTNPVTAILYISSDHQHINELKHALHVQEVDIAPAQDVNSIAIHKHGHHMAGFATLFWTIFVILIIIFHLFLIKLIYRELCAGTDIYESNSTKKFRYARTV